MDVTFKAVGTPSKTGYGINCEVQRHDLALAEMDALLTGASLAVVMTADPNADADAPGQELLSEDMDGLSIALPASCNGFDVRSDVLRFRLHTSRDVDIAKLSRFNYRKGAVSLKRIGDAQADEEEEEETS